MEIETLIEVLEASVKKNGEKPLTNLYLLNILKMVERKLDQKDDCFGMDYSDIF